MDAFHIPNLLPMLKNSNEKLDQIQKSLEAYLETKRAVFPRFYFLSNDELLSILSQTRNPEAVQEHLCKCFDSINRVKFQEGANIIEGMTDMIGEFVGFPSPITAGTQVEAWLNLLEAQMVLGLYSETRNAFVDYPEDGRFRRDWLFGNIDDGFPSQ